MDTKLDHMINKLFNGILKIVLIIGCIMLVISWVYVGSRYFLHQSLTWGEEYLKLNMVWFGLLSATVIAHEREHIGIVIFLNKMPKNVQNACKIVSQVIMLFVSIVITYIGVELVIRARGQIMPAMSIPIGIGYSAIPICYGIMILYEIRNLISDIKALRRGQEMGQKA